MAKEKIITGDIAEEEFWSDQIKEKEEKNSLTVENTSGEESEWLDENYDGQLSVDVYQTERDVIIKSTIAGVKPEDIDISFNNDMITIRGVREQQEEINKEDYFYQECYWGGFSRSIILPVEVKSDKAEAVLENGILIITLPKAIRAKSTTIRVKEKK
ncbi:MAG: heat-shock protein Hsp20 [Candidatus Kerfeldbacteria bacterium CG08_land_8_20_14_0_20_40_16]|uniref:Heat-shock protein Hsp20 n=1 Tax=Candidatus Kerfeldbacteria bacterium CG08_land_8_20_14_0_20_40_16 TaxID=2014244 RepID=A0A2H0YUH9_9BACT|nr:MAG: heat-shock protein Hsp20 [Candidatus Kerfeldbacteria bacterium CG08_land_8_20_14_0_20_40_16]